MVESGPKEDGRKSNGKKAVLEDLEQDLSKVVTQLRGKGKPVTSHVMKEARLLYIKMFSIGSEDYDILQRWAKYRARRRP